jgi:hypothetical protein
MNHKNYKNYDWENTLAWLRANPGAEPGGDPDLFDVPLPTGFAPGKGEWEGGPHWDESGVGIEWRTPAGVSFVFPADGEPYIELPDGTIVR